MASGAGRCVICYDIPDDKRRTRLSKCLDGYGDRVQYSVFEAVLNRELFDSLLEDVRGIIDPGEDRVSVFSLCGSCAGRVRRLGISSSESPGEEIVFVV